MASRYWVGGTDDWNGTAGTKWATTSGGAGGAAVPTSSDDVFFDANSGAVTVSVPLAYHATCHNIDFTGFTGIFYMVGNIFVDNSYLDVYGSMTLGAGMTWQASIALASFYSSSAETFTSNGISVTNAGSRTSVVFNFRGTGSWTMQDNFNSPSVQMNTLQGTLDFNNKDITVWSLGTGTGGIGNVTLNGGTGTLYLEEIDVSLFGGGAHTFTANTSSLHLVIHTGDNITSFDGFNGPGGYVNIFNNMTFSTLVTGHVDTVYFNGFATSSTSINVTDFTLDPVNAGVSDGVYSFGDAFSIVCSGTFTANGTVSDEIYMLNVVSPGSQYTISAAVASVSYINVTDSVALGAAIPFDDYPGGVDGGNNVNWIFTAPPVGGFTPIVMII